MRIGIATTDFESTYTNLPTEIIFKKISDYGYKSVQLSFASLSECGYISNGQFDIPPQISNELIDIVIKYAQKCDIGIASVNGTYNMCHPDKDIRDEGIRRFNLLAHAAKKINAPIITLCSGSRCREHMWTPHADNKTESAWNDMYQSMLRLTEIAENTGITLAIETEASNIIDTPEQVRRILDSVGSSHLKMILDGANLFHAGTAKRENVRKVLIHAFDLFGADIVLAHGKDILEGDGIDFCATGEGIIDFAFMKSLLDKYSFNGDMIIHGVYDENKMASVYSFIDNICNKK